MTNHLLFTIYGWLLTAHCGLPTTYYLPPTTAYALLTTHCVLLTTHRSPPQERTRYSVRRAHHTKQEGIKAYRTSLDQISGKSTTRLIETTSTERASPAVLLEISTPNPSPNLLTLTQTQTQTLALT